MLYFPFNEIQWRKLLFVAVLCSPLLGLSVWFASLLNVFYFPIRALCWAGNGKLGMRGENRTFISECYRLAPGNVNIKWAKNHRDWVSVHNPIRNCLIRQKCLLCPSNIIAFEITLNHIMKQTSLFRNIVFSIIRFSKFKKKKKKQG